MRKRNHSRQAARRHHRSSHTTTLKSLYRRPLRYEPLEDRRLLALVTVNTLSDVTNLNDNLTTLREAIFATNLVGGADTIDFAPALTASGPATILLTNGELKVTDSLTITGPGADLLTIDGQQKYRIFNINSNNTQIDVSISGVHLTRGNGAIYSTETLTLSELLVDQSTSNAAILSSSSGTLTMDNSRVKTNQGNAIHAYSVSIRDCEIADNTGTGLLSVEATKTFVADSVFFANGNSGLQVRGSKSVQILRTTFTDNYGLGDAGGLSVNSYGTVFVSDCTITRNTGANTNVGGGGAYFKMGTGGNARVERCSFTDNHAPAGAGLSAQGKIEIVDCEFSRNITAAASSGRGGGIQLFSLNQGSQLVSGSTFRDNIAYLNGGAIYIAQSEGSIGRTVSLVGNTIIGNAADGSGGGIAVFANHDVIDIDATAVEANHAYLDGGGIFVQASQSSQIRIANSTLNSNSARQSGGGLSINSTSSEVVIQQSTISGNTAVGTGGGLSMTLSGGNATIAHSTITQNGFATKSGSGLYTSGSGSLNINHTIIAGNVGNVQSSVDYTNRITNRMVKFSLIGNSLGSGLTPAPIGSPDANGNLIGGTTAATTINAKLGPLAENGGFTLPDGSHILTHALLPGSPAINAGDPTAAMGVAGVPLHDERGAPFIRVYGGRIDMGAVESQPAALLGDYNSNGVVDAADYVLWRISTPSVPNSSADGNSDGQVNGADRVVWQANFGETAAAASLTAASTTAASANPSIAAIAAEPSMPHAAQRTPPARRPAWPSTCPNDGRPTATSSVLTAVISARDMQRQPSAIVDDEASRSPSDRLMPINRKAFTVVDAAFATFQKTPKMFRRG